MIVSSRRAIRLVIGALAAASCAAGAWKASAIPLVPAMSVPAAPPMQPVIIATGGKTGLEFWPLEPKGGQTPTPISGISGLQAGGLLAASGPQIVIPNGNSVLIYNLQTKHSTILPDPGGNPIDAAVGRDHTIYVSNDSNKGSNLFVYPTRGKPYQVSCGLPGPDYIAVDNEGDVFFNDLGLTEVVELPRGPAGLDARGCTKLKLTPAESGYAAGIAIDPKTDDLLVLDDPSLCAGGLEGRLIVHPKPYEHGPGRELDLGQNCSGGLRLNADSTLVFIGDQDVSASYSFILQSSYPGGTYLGAYRHGNAGGFITVPNSLPN